MLMEKNGNTKLYLHPTTSRNHERYGLQLERSPIGQDALQQNGHWSLEEYLTRYIGDN